MDASKDAVAINGGDAVTSAQQALQRMGADARAANVATKIERPMAIASPLVASDPSSPHIRNQSICLPAISVAVRRQDRGSVGIGVGIATPIGGAGIMGSGWQRSKAQHR